MDPNAYSDAEMIGALLVYLAPAVIALLRRHQSVGAIFLLNLLLGWTGIGWLVALIWSFTGVWRRA